MEVARLWREQPSNLRLEGSRCTSCEALLFPEHIRCPECGSRDMQTHRFDGHGLLLSQTVVYEAPRGFTGQVPYVAGLVRLDEGPVIAAMITDVEPEDVRVGMRLEMVTRRISCGCADSPILYGYKFAPEELNE